MWNFRKDYKIAQTYLDVAVSSLANWDDVSILDRLLLSTFFEYDACHSKPPVLYAAPIFADDIFLISGLHCYRISNFGSSPLYAAFIPQHLT